jgi:hypothetical protein
MKSFPFLVLIVHSDTREMSSTTTGSISLS